MHYGVILRVECQQDTRIHFISLHLHLRVRHHLAAIQSGLVKIQRSPKQDPGVLLVSESRHQMLAKDDSLHHLPERVAL